MDRTGEIVVKLVNAAALVRLSTPLAWLNVHVLGPATFDHTPPELVNPATLKVPPYVGLVTSTSVHEPSATAGLRPEVSMAKVPSNVALPAPVSLLLEPTATAKVMVPAASRTSEQPLLTVVLPLNASGVMGML